MNPRVKSVKPNPDYTLVLLFTNGETRAFDVRPYLDKGIFRELKDPRNFNSVKPFLGSIQWQNGQDFALIHFIRTVCPSRRLKVSSYKSKNRRKL
jgi:hypothetical protein